MNRYSISHLTDDEYEKLILYLSKRRKHYWVFSLLIIPAPLMLGCALLCDMVLTCLKTGGKRHYRKLSYASHIILGLFIPLFIICLARFIPWVRHLILGVIILK